jgi:hypothetical protein
MPSAVWAERASSEGLGTCGVGAGAALWFGGAVALSVRRTTTVRRGLTIVMSGAIGSALIVLALSFGWSGAVLALAMEFGVGALAIVVIDVIVIGAIQPGLESLARQADSASVDLQFGWRWPPIAIRIHHTASTADRVDG